MINGIIKLKKVANIHKLSIIQLLHHRLGLSKALFFHSRFFHRQNVLAGTVAQSTALEKER